MVDLRSVASKFEFGKQSIGYRPKSRRWRNGAGHGNHVLKKSLIPMTWLCVLWLPVKPSRVVRKAAW
jgi:hypothetical protein